MDRKMKGGIEWPVVSIVLVFLGMFVLTMTIGFYLRSAVTEEPIEIRTYTEYRWMNYFPSSVLFYLSYLPDSWTALNELVKADYEKKEVLNIEEFYNKYPEIEGMSKLKELIDALAEETQKESNTFIIKDKKGLIISMGLTREKLEGLIVTYPEEYPYNCFYKDMPIFSTEGENMRVKFVYCCSRINRCGDYLTGPGRMECSTDPCGVGPCKFFVCLGEDDVEECMGKDTGSRICVDISSQPILPEPEEIETPCKYILYKLNGETLKDNNCVAKVKGGDTYAQIWFKLEYGSSDCNLEGIDLIYDGTSITVCDDKCKITYNKPNACIEDIS